VHQVEPNIYASSGTLSRNSNVYEDVEIKIGNSDRSNQAIEENHAYIVMNGSDKYVTGNVSKASDVTDGQPPEYQNSPEEIAEEDEITITESGMMGYDVPRPANIYSEIPGADSDIYESFDDLKL